ncbi:hypothetical protein K1719_041822 [Acacia pycnantha]|nr:hypothetical protein K1719_041822 [Acacia pycnantha]
MKPFRRTLIVKLVGRQLSYGFMVKRLRAMWARKGDIDVFDMENEFYLINFQSNDDYMEALIGGPWVIADAYLNVARWRPDFNPKNVTIDSVVAWVRFPDLPAPLFDKKFLLNLGNAIGKAIRLDVHTAQRARGKFARMCVEIDLTKPLVPEFNVEGQILSVVYESLGMICQKCGRVGHNQEGCGGSEASRKDGEMEVERTEPKENAETVVDDGGGRWKTVIRNRRPRSNAPETREFKGGGRFNVLMEEPEAGNRILNQDRGHQSNLKKINVERTQQEGSSKPQKKIEVTNIQGERSRKQESVGPLSMRRKDQGGKTTSLEKDNTVEKGVGARKSMDPAVMNSNFEHLSESNGVTQKRQGVRLNGKENLNPGDAAKLNSSHVTPTGITSPSKGKGGKTEGFDQCMEEGCRTSVTAD